LDTEKSSREKLLKAIREKAYRTGDFTLASGQKSDYYIDLKEVTLDAEGSLMIGKVIFAAIRDWGAQAVGGMELGSVPTSTAVCIVSAIEGEPVANFIVRKQAKGHGAGKRLEGNVGAGTKVVVVEDVVSTGGSSVKAIGALREAGAEVIGVVSIVDREMGGREAFGEMDVRYEPIFTVSDVRYYRPS